MKLTSITIDYEKWGENKVIPVFEKITNQKFEDVKGETDFGFKKKELC